MNRIQTIIRFFILSSFVIASMGCKDPFIEKLNYKIPPNLQTVQLILNFTKEFQLNVGGSFPVKNYGTVDLTPSSSSGPFKIGFSINLEIFNDNEFIHYSPVTRLPSGTPIPGLVNRAMAQFKLNKPVNAQFDLYTYIDVLPGKGNGEWVGVALLLNFLNENSFPAGLNLSKSFVKNANGQYQVSANLFGPSQDPTNGNKTPGGIGLFGNIAALYKTAKPSGSDEGETLFFFTNTFISDGFKKDPYFPQYEIELNM